MFDLYSIVTCKSQYQICLVPNYREIFAVGTLLYFCNFKLKLVYEAIIDLTLELVDAIFYIVGENQIILSQVNTLCICNPCAMLIDRDLPKSIIN